MNFNTRNNGPVVASGLNERLSRVKELSVTVALEIVKLEWQQASQAGETKSRDIYKEFIATYRDLYKELTEREA